MNDRARQLFVVACGAAKRDHPAPARDLYTGDHFRYVLTGVEREADATLQALGIHPRVLILSAEHGLVDPDTVLAPYERTMTDSGSVTARRLAEQLLDYSQNRPIEVYAFLPRAYLARLRKAAALADDQTPHSVCVIDVYEAAPGIGHQRAVIASLSRLPVRP